MKLKVCGMRLPENIKALTALNPDYMGFIFWAPSSRFVDSSTPPLSKEIKKTGVFVDASLDYIETIIKDHNLQAVQLHGKENPEYCSYIKNLDVEVIKAFSVKDHFDFSSLDPYESACDFYLYQRENTKIEEKLELKKIDLPLYAIDVNSKFETAPGVKKIDELEQFKNELYEL